MKKYLILPLLFFISLTVYGQNKNLTILCIAAHPDDEDGATLAYYSKLMGYNAYTIFYTRGEGGQNETGPELYDELGKIRERECHEAAEIQGSQAYFLGMLDFGYSKTAKETFKFWSGEDSVLARIVYMIRKIRPEVVISNHDTITTKPNRQHGHHQVAGITIYKAFEKAADPNYHPEHLVNSVTPWQVKKLFFRVYDTARTNDIYAIDISQKDKTSKTIEEISYDALAKHKTQGMDKVERTLRGMKKYELIRSDNMYPLEGNDLFSGIRDDEPKQKFTLESYPTFYTYRKVNPEDSLRLLSELKVNKFEFVNMKIGYVKTYDNTIENILKAFNIKYDTLTDQDFEKPRLLGYSTIILDLRAYLHRNDLIKNNDKILEYVRGGGNIICFYNKPTDVNNKDVFPYSLFITNERVTEEDAIVTIFEPHYLFRTPNLIEFSDWNEWIQERNVYLPSADTSKTSTRYHKLLAMQDEDDPVPNTSLLFANYGFGKYIYCSLALYRQLKIFHKGALKLFLNMISMAPRIR